MLQIILACVGMAARDCLGTLLVIAEARGRAVMAGALDATGDLASILVTVVGAGEVITHGLTPHTIILLAAMTVTSFVGTTIFTKLGQRISASKQTAKAIALRDA